MRPLSFHATTDGGSGLRVVLLTTHSTHGTSTLGSASPSTRAWMATEPPLVCLDALCTPLPSSCRRRLTSIFAAGNAGGADTTSCTLDMTIARYWLPRSRTTVAKLATTRGWMVSCLVL